MAHFVEHSLREYDHLHVLNFSNAFVTEITSEHQTFFTQTLGLLRKNLLELHHPRWLPSTPLLQSMLQIEMPRLRVLHLPKLQTTIQINCLVSDLPKYCPQLQEIGFRIDDTTTALPIDSLFSKIESLTALDLKFDVPKSLLVLNRDPEDLMGRPFNNKLLITQGTYSKLRKFRCEFNHEGLFKAWVDMTLLIQFAKNLHCLEIKRKLQYKSLCGRMSWERGG